jgi:glycerophosphocholine phosphodiesterase GPCPD1
MSGWFQTGKMEDNLQHYKERNEYVDIILREILQYAYSRRIILSCFDPDICTMYVLQDNVSSSHKRSNKIMAPP